MEAGRRSSISIVIRLFNRTVVQCLHILSFFYECKLQQICKHMWSKMFNVWQRNPVSKSRTALYVSTYCTASSDGSYKKLHTTRNWGNARSDLKKLIDIICRSNLPLHPTDMFRPRGIYTFIIKRTNIHSRTGKRVYCWVN